MTYPSLMLETTALWCLVRTGHIPDLLHALSRAVLSWRQPPIPQVGHAASWPTSKRECLQRWQQPLQRHPSTGLKQHHITRAQPGTQRIGSFLGCGD